MFANYAYKVNISIHNAEPCVFAPAAKKKTETLPTPAKLLAGVRWRAAAFSLTAEKPKTLYARKVAFMMEVERIPLFSVHKKSAPL
jgi:hypothetical protein